MIGRYGIAGAYGLGMAGAALVLALPIFAPGMVGYAIGLFMYATLAMGWNLQGGYLGDLSFGHVAFFGLGGYGVALLIENHILDWGPINVIVGALGAAAFAAVIGVPFLRLKGFYFAIGTLGLSGLLALVFKNLLEDVTHGAAGIMVPAPQPYHIETFYYSILGIAVLTLVGSAILIRSRVGLAFRAVRDNPEAAYSLGIHVTFYRVLGFAVSAFVVGLVGGFYAYYTNYLNPDGMFAATVSFEMLVMVFLGGAGTLGGPLLGAVVFYVLQEVGRQYIGQGFYILPALILIIVFMFLPSGLMGVPLGRRPRFGFSRKVGRR
ncbi:MAG: branched-chain amino acid ABC transporter permease [Thermoleophilia bacterium]|nr:branched-chain amino acid ABC transporter permease [Thermoleophilia bacterium]